MRRGLPSFAALVPFAVWLAFASTPAVGYQLRGAQMHPLWADSGTAVIEREYGLLRSAGANSVRIDLSWQELEPTRGVMHLPVVSKMDWILPQAAAHGLKVILTLWESPCWASSAPTSVTGRCVHGWWSRRAGGYPPAHPQDYADAASFVARRWGRALAALEVWNEPNGTGYFKSADQAGAYASLLRAAYPAVKAKAPQLPVLMTMAGSSPSFLGALYADGARGHYDGIAVHPYGDPGFVGLQAFRAFELAQGDSTPLWVTEFGWPSNLYGLQGQADLVGTAMTQLAAFPYVAAAEVYNLRDKGTDARVGEDNFGLLNRALDPKPAWRAFAHALADLAAWEGAPKRSMTA